MTTTAKTIDPVFRMEVDPATAAGTSEHAGRRYAFCSASCKQRFDAEPEHYADKAEASEQTQAHRHDSSVARPERVAGAIYTCPMHPEVRESQPGSCPKCGMALEPASPVPASRTEWTCPMHPEIVRDATGSCLICGMALEPRTVSAD
jgi:Cu+-exporting ATPase